MMRIFILVAASLMCAGAAQASRFQLICEHRCDVEWGDAYLSCMDNCLNELDPIILATGGLSRREPRNPDGLRALRNLLQPAAHIARMRQPAIHPSSMRQLRRQAAD
ncbi:hypothetical protein ACERNI_05180 [Camelimonas sp. ID_303_24]